MPQGKGKNEYYPLGQDLGIGGKESTQKPGNGTQGSVVKWGNGYTCKTHGCVEWTAREEYNEVMEQRELC